jgi:hypothetical protein
MCPVSGPMTQKFRRSRVSTVSASYCSTRTTFTEPAGYQTQLRVPLLDHARRTQPATAASEINATLLGPGLPFDT